MNFATFPGLTLRTPELFSIFWNIPYSKFSKKIVVLQFFWKFQNFDFFFKYEYGIFQKKIATTKLLKNLGIWNIPWNISGIFQKIENSSGGRKV